MSTSLPVICSNYGPMPEIIKDATIFFDPENIDSIAKALYEVITNDELRLKNSEKSYDISMNFSWKKCSNLTFQYINNKIANEYK